MSPGPPRALRIVIPGGTGHLGTLLAQYFHSQGHSVTVLGRFPAPRPWPAVHWDPPELGEWAVALEGADALINLTSSDAAFATSSLAAAVAQCVQPPRLWLNAGALDDDGRSTPTTLKVVLNIAPVMSPDARSSFAGLLRLVRFALVGRGGSGGQSVCWIHDRDFVHAIEFVITQDGCEGAIDICSSHSLPSEEFLACLREAWNPLQLAFAYPDWLVEACAFLLRADTQPILQDCRSMPSHLLRAGFEFDFPDWSAAALDLVSRWRALHS
jgi:NAD dependent epimerase/dehydratase family enzyme